MKRRIIQIAESTQLVSLPRKWAVAHNLKKGDEIEVVESGDDLIIKTNASARSETTTIDVTKTPNLAVRYLIAAYRSGYDEVKVIYDDPKVFQSLQRVASSILMGFEIVNQGEQMCVFRNISENLHSELQNILRRAWLITLTLAHNVYDITAEQQYARVPEALTLETTNNKFTLFCQRLLAKFGDGSPRRTAYRFVAVYQLEKIADHYKYICEHLQRTKPRKIRKETLKLFKQVNELLGEYYEVFYKFDPQRADRLAKSYEQLQAFGEKCFESAPGSEDEIVHNLLAILQLTFNLVGVQLALEL
jgi:phosphate uptake regulator